MMRGMMIWLMGGGTGAIILATEASLKRGRKPHIPSNLRPNSYLVRGRFRPIVDFSAALLGNRHLRGGQPAP